MKYYKLQIQNSTKETLGQNEQPFQSELFLAVKDNSLYYVVDSQCKKLIDVANVNLDAHQCIIQSFTREVDDTSDRPKIEKKQAQPTDAPKKRQTIEEYNAFIDSFDDDITHTSYESEDQMPSDYDSRQSTQTKYHSGQFNNNILHELGLLDWSDEEVY